MVAAIIAGAVIGVVGIVLLWMASQGMIPDGFGLWDMGSDVNRAIVFVVLLVLVALLWVAYRKTRGDGAAGPDERPGAEAHSADRAE